MNTKILVVVSILIGMGGLPMAAKDSGGGPAVLRTLDGRVFHVTELVQVDPNGLLFRHRKGIAKVTFDQLDAGVRKEFAYDAGKAKEFERAGKPGGAAALAKKSPAAKSAGESKAVVKVTSITRTFVPGPVYASCAGAYGVPFAYCALASGRSHWARYRPAGILAQYPFRYCAEYELLQASGFLPWQKRGVAFRY